MYSYEDVNSLELVYDKALMSGHLKTAEAICYVIDYLQMCIIESLN